MFVPTEPRSYSVMPLITPQADKNGLQHKRYGEEGMMKVVEYRGVLKSEWRRGWKIETGLGGYKELSAS